MSSRQKKAREKRVEKRHECTFCSAKFAFPNKLRYHIQSTHSKSHPCEHCEERFDRFYQLRTHIKFAHKIRHQCEFCAYFTSVKAELRKHIHRNHENGVRCTVDGCTTTIAFNRLRRHLREKHGQNDSAVSDASPPIEPTVFNTEPPVSLTPVKGDENGIVGDGETDAVNDEDNKATLVGSAGVSDVIEKVVLIGNEDVDDEELCLNEKDTSSEKLFIFELDEEKLGIGTTADVEETGDVKKFDESMSNEEKPDEKPSFTVNSSGDIVCQICKKCFPNRHKARKHWRGSHSTRHAIRNSVLPCTLSGCDKKFNCNAKLKDHISGVHLKEMVASCETCDKKFNSRSQFAVHLRRYHQVSIRDAPAGFTLAAAVN